MDGIGFVDFVPSCRNYCLAVVRAPWIMVREKPYWFRLALAIFGICLYSADVGSDILVGVDLIERCHNRYAASVFSFTMMPGFLFGFMLICMEALKDGCSWKLFLVLLAPLGGALAGILFIPFGLVVLIWSAIKLDSSDRARDAKE